MSVFLISPVFWPLVWILLFFAGSTGEVQPEKTPTTEQKIVYLVIDDVGNNTKDIDLFLTIPVPLTFAILPGLPWTRYNHGLLRHHQKYSILHQPMEALGGNNPGPGAILSTMDSQEIQRVLLDNFSQLPGVVGFNNHMGSKITSNSTIMESVLRFARDQGYYFFDSKTIDTSVVVEVGQSLGLTIYERDVFLDNNNDYDAIRNALYEGLKIVDRQGYAIMIGHVWSQDLARVLLDEVPNLILKGYTFKTIDQLYLPKVTNP